MTPETDYLECDPMSDAEITAILLENQRPQSRKAAIDRKYKTSPNGARRRREQRAERRRTDPEYREKIKAQGARHKLKWNDRSRARGLLSHAVNRKTITPKPCEVCGNQNTEAHHRDYLRPLDVSWLCFKHHREVGHGQVVTAAA